jgi:multiple sugar transport system ATP-binding protein
MLELRAVLKRFGTNVAVSNLSFQCREQEFLVIFGPAGAGKSTTLRLVAGIAQPNRGDVFFRGHSLLHVPPERRNFSMVFENYALYAHIPVFENLAFPLRARKLPEAEIKRRVAQMAEILQIGALLERRPGQLSGGQRQRVALGRGLIREADVYLLDEPISHLDARLRLEMRAELKAICTEKQATVLHVTHDYREAMALADRVLVLNKGKLMQHGSPAEIYHCPANEFVASFVGDPPMSFLNVEYTEDRGRPGFRVIGQPITLDASPEMPHIAREKNLTRDMRLAVRATETTVHTIATTHHTVPAEVYVVEAQGHRNLLTVKIGENLLQVAAPTETSWKLKDTVWLNLSPANLHVFADEVSIYHPPRSMAAGMPAARQVASIGTRI